MELKILPEIEENLFPLQDDEYKFLEESILKDGIRDALVVWPRDGELILVDGHNRYKIAQKHNIPFKVVEKQFNDLDEVLEWVDFNQLGRRNLIDEQRTYVLGRLYERRKKKLGRPAGEKVDNLSTYSGSAATAREIAAQSNTNEKTVRRAAEFTKAVDEVRKVDPEAADRILSGEITGAKTYLPKIVKDQDILPKIAEKLKISKFTRLNDVLKETRKEEIKEKREKILQKVESVPADDRWEILIGDISNIVLDKKFDFIITDPPYLREYLPLYKTLAFRSREWLKEDGLLVVMCGQSYLDEIISMMAEHISYYWIGAYLTPGQPTPLRQRQVNTSWKPILVFGKKDYHGKIFGDVFKSDLEDKALHDWQQSVSGMLSIIKQLCVPGQSILDPFCGTGTTGVAAIMHKCLFTGVEIDSKTAEIARKRLVITTSDEKKI